MHKKIPTIISYVAIVAFWIAYWPVSTSLYVTVTASFLD